MKIRPKTIASLEEQERRKEYYQKNKAEINNYNRKYHAEHLAYYRDWTAKYQAENMPYYIMKAREQYARDPEKCIEKGKKWAKNNVERVRDLSKQRRESMKENTKKMREEFFAEERKKLKESESSKDDQNERLEKILKGEL